MDERKQDGMSDFTNHNHKGFQDSKLYSLHQEKKVTMK